MAQRLDGSEVDPRRAGAIVAEENEFCRLGLARILTRKLHFGEVREARSAADLEKALGDPADPLLIALDCALPGLDGEAALRRIRVRFPESILVVVSEAKDRRTVLSCLAAGVNGYLPKNYSSNEIAAALRTIVNGAIFIPPFVAHYDEEVQETAQASLRDRAHAEDLTPRQTEILALISGGYSNKEIARLLSITPGTVKVHIHAAYRALGVHNRVLAAEAAREL